MARSRNSVLRPLACLLLTLLAATSYESERSEIDALRDLAARIKADVDRAADGIEPAAGDFAELHAQLLRFGQLEAMSSDRAFADKVRAVSYLDAELRDLVSGRPDPILRPARLRAAVDVEVVSARHGGTCAHALGIAPDLPVQVALGDAGTAGSDAWFRLDAAAAHVRFATDSHGGGDPVLRVYASCDPKALPIAENDDSVGLDAVVSATARGHEAVFAHLINTGRGGSLVLAATTATPTVSGKVTDVVSGLPIQYANVTLVTGNGGYAGSASTDVSGNYTVQTNGPDTLYLRVDASQHISELYPDAPCAYGSYYFYIDECDVADAQAIVVPSDATITGIDVALRRGQMISGTVRSNADDPISAIVDLYDASGRQLGSRSTLSDGTYAFTTIPPGDYELVAHSGAYGSQVFDHVACTGPLQTECTATSGTSVSVASQDVAGVDFNLQLLASIQGSATGIDLQPIPGSGSVQIVVIDPNGTAVAYGGTDAYGRYSAGPLGVGDYYVYASSWGYFSQLFDGVDCGTSCAAITDSAQLISIDHLGQVVSADFRLHELPRISGHVQDADTGYPLANVQIYPTTSLGYPTYYPNAVTDSEGNYTLSYVPPGQYYLWAQSSDHVDEIYADIPCESYSYYYQALTFNCNIVGASLLTIAPGEIPPAFDFALRKSASISGRATIRAQIDSNLPANAQISIYNGSGSAVANANTDSLGNYIVTDLGPGTYFAVATGAYGSQYISQVWENENCSGTCFPVTGSAIVAGTAQSVTGIDFALTRIDAIVGRVTDKHGVPIPAAYVDLFSSTTDAYAGSGISDSDGYYAAKAPTGQTYFLGTDAGSGYRNQVYSGISCPQGPAYESKCAFDGATAVSLSGQNTQPIIVNFMLQPADTIFSSGFE